MFKKIWQKKTIKQQKAKLGLFFLKLSILIEHDLFRKKIDIIKRTIIDNLTDEELLKLNININSLSFQNDEVSLNLNITNGSIEFIINIKDKNKEIEAKEVYIKKQNDIILKSFKEETLFYDSYNETQKEEKISLFTNYVEMFNESINEKQRYQYINDQKIYFKEDYLHNKKETTKIMRTKQNNLIKLSSETYYNEGMQNYNKTNYYKGKGSTDDYFSLPLNGDFLEISKSECNDFIEGKITEDKMFENFSLYLYIKNRFKKHFK